MVILVVSRWGVFLDRYGSVPMMFIATLTSTFISLVWLFASPGVIWPMFISNFFGGMFWCAHDAGMANMQLSHTPSEGRPAALAVYAVFTSIAAATAIITGGAVLETLSPIMERANLTIAGTPFDHYKLNILIGMVMRVTVVFIFLPRVWNEKEMSPREAYAKFYQDASSRFAFTVSQIRTHLHTRRFKG